MNYNVLLDVAMQIGYQLAMSGAETYRIEESVLRIMTSYGIEVEVFSIPNCLHVSIQPNDAPPLTRMRRVSSHGSDLDAVEKFSNLSRRICAEHPDPEIAMQWLTETEKNRRNHSFPMYLIGNYLGACGFAATFGAGITDCLCAGICGLVIGLVNSFMDKMKANHFFKIILSAFLMALVAYWGGHVGVVKNTDAVIIGALMILVPGLLFTNAMRDIIYGDTNSGINRIVQVLLIAVAIALGTAVAWNTSSALWGVPASSVSITQPLWFELIGCFLGSVGFFILFNIFAPGGFLCALGGVISWFVLRVTMYLGCGDIAAHFWAILVTSIYSEVMARIRKYPAISYLVISSFPLIPGAGVYYAMTHAVRGETAEFATRGMHTAAVAGTLAVGILIASTSVRLVHDWIHKKHHQEIKSRSK